MKKTSGVLAAAALLAGAFQAPAFASGPAIDAGTIVAGCKYNATGGPAFSADGFSNLQCDQNGNLKVTATSSTGTSSGAYQPSPYPTYAPGASVSPLTDQYGALLVSPYSIIRGSVGQYQVNPQTLIDTQSSQLLTDINGRARVTFENPQPVYLAPEANHYTQRGGPFINAGTPQLFADADLNRRGMYIQNQCPNAIWLSLFGDSVTQDSYPNIEIRPGQMYETAVNFTPTSAIFVFSRSVGCGFAGATY